MIFMTCSTVTPGFGVRIVSTPVILGRGVWTGLAPGAPRPSRKPAAGKTLQSSWFRSLDSQWSFDVVLVPPGTTLSFRRSRGEKVAPGMKDNGTIRYQRCQGRGMATTSKSKRGEKSGAETAVRERILEAAFAAFRKSGYATASTLEIASRARVSKRELYALVGNKQEMLIACISERAKRFGVPADLPVLRDRETLEQVLASFGTKLVREVSDPTVIAVFRLAIAEAVQAPEV